MDDLKLNLGPKNQANMQKTIVNLKNEISIEKKRGQINQKVSLVKIFEILDLYFRIFRQIFFWRKFLKKWIIFALARLIFD